LHDAETLNDPSAVVVSVLVKVTVLCPAATVTYVVQFVNIEESVLTLTC